MQYIGKILMGEYIQKLHREKKSWEEIIRIVSALYRVSREEVESFMSLYLGKIII